METNRRLFKKLLAFTLAVTVLTACEKEEKEVVDSDTQSSSDNALAESAFNDVTSISDQAHEGNLSTFKTFGTDGLLSNCANIVRQKADSTNSDTLLITFGFNNGANPAVNCLCNDGRYRRGTIKVVYTGKYRDSLSTHTLSFNNYFVNDNQLLGGKIVTNLGRNAAGHPRFSVDVNGSVVLANNGGTITWISNRTREWIAGYTTFGPGNWNDDVYLITGTASGTGASGNTFTATITSPLKRSLSCRWIESGTFDFTPAGKATRSVDYGNGLCDDQATVTINGNVYNVILR
jgi:hypothetical protein